MTEQFPPFTSGSWAAAPPWSPTPPPPRPSRGQGPGVLVVTLAVIIAVLLAAGGVGAAVSSSGGGGGGKVASGRSPSSSSSTLAPPGTGDPGATSTLPPPGSTQPGTPPTTGAAGVAPVSPLGVPPVTAPPVKAQPLNLAPAVIASMVNPSVVDINAPLAFQHATAAGTGMVLTSTGVVLTNNHVIDGAASISGVSVGTGRTYTAHVLGVDPSADVAVLQLEGASGLRAISASTAAVTPGDPVVALGNAGGLGGPPSVSTGTVVATGQSIIASDPGAGTSEQLNGLIETNATLRPGDSGGPLVNGAGQVIGMDTAASVPGQGTRSVSFAIPIGQALAIARQIQAGQPSSTIHLGLPPFLGVQVTTTAGPGGRIGAVVAGVVAGSPAAVAGLVPGSLIASINGRPIDAASTLTAVLRQYRPGDSVTLTWIGPTGASRSARVTLGTGPAD